MTRLLLVLAVLVAVLAPPQVAAAAAPAPPPRVLGARSALAGPVPLRFAAAHARWYRCALDAQPLRRCPARIAPRLTAGRHLVRVQAVDRRGRRSRTASVWLRLRPRAAAPLRPSAPAPPAAPGTGAAPAAPAPAPAPPATQAAPALEETHGLRVFPGGLGAVVSYAALVRNPTGLQATGVHVLVELLDAGGRVVVTAERAVAVLAPHDAVALADTGLADELGADDDGDAAGAVALRVTTSVGAWGVPAPTVPLQASAAQLAAHGRVLVASGTVSAAAPLDGVAVVALWRDAAGALLGGASTCVEHVDPSVAAAVETDPVEAPADVAAAELVAVADPDCA